MAAAVDLGLSADAIEGVTESALAEDTLTEVFALATALGLNGTPSYVIADDIVFGAVGYDELATRVASVRECGSTSC
jgi:protein-disulfide isomerase